VKHLFGVSLVQRHLRDDRRLSSVLWIALAVAYLWLAVGYSFAIPPQQSIDEGHHLGYVADIVQARGLPLIHAGSSSEEFQPPLYYVSAAAISQAALALGLSTRLGISEAFLELICARWLSALSGLLTAWCAWRLATLVFRGRSAPSLLATALVVLDPTFLSISASVSNDGFATAFSSLALLMAAETAFRGVSRRRTAIAGVALGLGTLSKLSALVAAGPLVVAFVLAGVAARRSGSVARHGVVVGACVVGLNGWWWWRGWQLYRDPFGQKLQAVLNPTLVRTHPMGLGEYPGSILDLSRTYLAALGPSGSVRAPGWVYWTWIAVLAVALVSLGHVWLIRRSRPFAVTPRSRLLIVAGAAIATDCAAIVFYSQSIDGIWHGRFLLPASAAISVLIVLGINALPRARRLVFVAVGGGLAALSVVFPIVYLAPLRQSARFVAGTPSQIQVHTDDSFAHGIQLAGSSPAENSVVAGTTAEVTLYWRTVAPVSDEWTVFVHLDTGDGQTVAQFNGLPIYPMRFWPPGKLAAQRVQLSIPPGLLPGVYTLKAGLYRHLAGTFVYPPVASFGDSTGAVEIPVGRVRVRLASPPRIARPDPVAFQEGVELLGSTWSNGQLTVYWRATGTPSRSYTVFVHLLDSSGRLVAGHDGIPALGNFNTTDWRAGDVVIDPHAIQAPPGRYRVQVGMYDLKTGERLHTLAGHDSVDLGPVIVR